MHEAAPGDLIEVLARFPLDRVLLDAAPYGTGHINDTYASRWQTASGIVRYIHQRINHNVFPDPGAIMQNIARVTRHLRERIERTPGGNPHRECLNLVPTREGALFHVDPRGGYWRTYEFIEHAVTLDVCTGPAQAFEAAAAFGRFQAMLADLPGGRLNEVIPYFHHTPRRLDVLERAVATDPAGRRADVRAEIEFVRARAGRAGRVVDLAERGALPVRVSHNDTKLNNVMLDVATGRGVCVIDLDTVMHGTVLYDFGDMVRSCTRTSAEDERDLARVGVRMDVFEALARGYLRSARSFLVAAEVENLVYSGWLVTLTIGVRFLADHLSGDVYFKTHRPGHNLDRARVHFQQVTELERLAAAMEATVRRLAGSQRPVC